MTTQTKTKGHTPGPWSIGKTSEVNAENPTRYNANSIFDADGNAVAQVYGIHINRSLEQVEEDGCEGLPNARLIAAAPDLLAALKLCVAQLTPSRNDRDLIAADEGRDAIDRCEKGGVL